MDSNGSDSPSGALKWDVFVCYRQVDGSETADWLHEHLQGKPIPATEDPPPEVRFYLDRFSAAAPDWRQLNREALERARAMIVVCTPGAKDDEGPDDEVQKEIRWWIENRQAAPILIDPTGSGTRYVPKRIRERWPNAQLVEVRQAELAKEEEAGLGAMAERVVTRILQGILLSEGKTRDEDLERTRRLQTRTATALRRAKIGLAATVIALAIAGVAGGLFFGQRNEANSAARLADRLRRTANLAWTGGLHLNRSKTADEAALGALLIMESLRREPGSLAGQLAWAQVLEYYPPLRAEWEIPAFRKTNAGTVAAFSPDGRHLAFSNDETRELTVLDLETGEPAFEVDTGQESPAAVTFDPRSNLLVAGSGSGVVRVWSSSRQAGSALGDLLNAFTYPEPVQALAFIGHGRAIAVAGTQSRVTTFDAGRWAEQTTVDAIAGDTTEIRFSPDGQWIATRSWNSSVEEYVVRIRDLASGRTIARTINADPYAMTLSRDGRHMAVNGRYLVNGDYKPQVRLYELALVPNEDRLSADHVETYPLTWSNASLAFDPLAARLSIGGEEGVRIFATRGARELAKIEQPGVQSVAFIEDGNALAVADADHVRIWDFTIGRSLAQSLTEANAPLDPAEIEKEIFSRFPEIEARIGRPLTAREIDEYLPPEERQAGSP